MQLKLCKLEVEFIMYIYVYTYIYRYETTSLYWTLILQSNTIFSERTDLCVIFKSIYTRINLYICIVQEVISGHFVGVPDLQQV